MAKKRTNGITWLWIIIGLMSIVYLFFLSRDFLSSGKGDLSGLPRTKIKRTERNYSKEVRQLSSEFNVPFEYLMSLIVLECSGFRPAGKRFERHVYRRLQKLRSGELSKFEDLTPSHVSDATDEALKNLATSWGPFQLMGYKCIGMGKNIKDIREDNSARYAVEWIQKEYGWLLDAGRYEDAFHYHNAGSVVPASGPRTHDPNYISKGIKYMEYFSD